MTDKPYTVGCSHDKKYYVQGPAPFGECSFYAGTPHSGLRFENEDEPIEFIFAKVYNWIVKINNNEGLL